MTYSSSELENIIIQQMSDSTIIDRDSLQAEYINTIIDGMDLKDLIAIVYDTMDENLDRYTVDELIEEVNEYYPELLDNGNN